MQPIHDITAMIGFGEAGQTFASASGRRGQIRVYDHLTDAEATREAKLAGYGAVGVIPALSTAEAVSDVALILSLVTADQALAVARAVAKSIAPGALFCDLNSVAPQTKRAAADLIEAAGGHYVDVAVMSPVQPAALSVPLLISGAKAQEAAQALTTLGFVKVQIAGGEVGRASSIKMIRSVMIKGLEALTAECVLAASEAGVLNEVVSSLDASWPGADWGNRADYNLDRMMIHGLRRSAEMQEVVRTLDGLGVGSAMSRGTIARQAAIGDLGLKSPPQGLIAKIAAVLSKGAKAT